MPELVEPTNDERLDALYTVVAGEGDGAMLALAAGDTAGGAWELGYSATTEQCTVLAYELIAEGDLDEGRLVAALVEMDGGSSEEAVFRAESPEFRAWLNRAGAGRPAPGAEPSLDAIPRSTLVGVAFREDPIKVIETSIRLGRMFHLDAGTVAAGVVAASAVAASCYAQSGIDLVAGVTEAVMSAGDGLTAGLVDADRVSSLQAELDVVSAAVGTDSGDEALGVVGGESEDPIQMALAGLLLAAPVVQRHHLPVEQAARIGGSRLGAYVGAIVGARVGIRAWPWAFANDTWFAEIGRRLVRGPREVQDLPIPYAVEQHLMSGGRPGFH